jgi:protein PhnA
MSFEKELAIRSANVCELSGSAEELVSYLVEPKVGNNSDEFIFITKNLKEQLDGTKELNPNDWRCLNESMWSEVEAVKVIAYRMLNQLKSEGWPADLIEMIYLEEDTLAWAKETMEDEFAVKHVDSNGVQIKSGDSVVLIKDLDVKGTSMVAKRGTTVRNIRVVHDNPELIEGKVNGQTIYILTQYVKK